MLLAIDVGNSNVSLGVFQGDALRLRAKLSATVLEAYEAAVQNEEAAVS